MLVCISKGNCQSVLSWFIMVSYALISLSHQTMDVLGNETVFCVFLYPQFLAQVQEYRRSLINNIYRINVHFAMN